MTGSNVGVDADLYELERKEKPRRRGRAVHTAESPKREQVDLWAQPSAEANADIIEKLRPLILELAAKAHPHPIIFANVRLAAVQRGLLTGRETGKDLSFGGAAMRAAGLVPTGAYRRSHIEESHGNLQAEWKLPEGSA